MRETMRRLPPLASLRAFEAAARHLSFKHAAAELFVTPTAISHQIKLLEDTIGMRLFERRTRQVVMTAAARLLYPVLRDGFDAFASTIDELSKRPPREVVTISATRAFTARWLVPRIIAFQKRRPDIDLRLLASDEVVDIRAGAADLAIRYGHKPPAGLHAEPLAVERYAPVAHPSVKLRRRTDLARIRLVHFEWHRPAPDNPTWRRWFKAAGQRAGDSPGLHFTDESHAIQAVAAGHGVGLLSLMLVADDLAAGALASPFGPQITGKGGYLVHSSERAMSAAVSAVRAWLLSELRQPPRSAR
jgi:LysR family transcriptional regulator, glycine cleavage system transcriptional activator